MPPQSARQPYLRRGLAAPCFAEDPTDLVDLAVAAEEAGFDGFFLWDHISFANDGQGPPIVDPWAVMSVIATRTSSIVIGPMITPVPRRRPWVLARQTATLDLLAGGRTVLGVGIGSPPHGDFGIFGDETDAPARGAMLDEGLEVIAGLWSGETYSFEGDHYRVEPVRFLPTPVQRPGIPIWVGGVLPARRPMLRATRWQGAVPIRFADRVLARPSAQDIADVADLVDTTRPGRDGYDLAVWAEVAPDPQQLTTELPEYVQAGATWWIETAKPEPGWFEGLQRRIAVGPVRHTG